MMICSVQQVSKMYGGNEIFHSISFDIPEGSRIGIVGPNGSGKTTLMKMIAGLEYPDSGKVHVKKGSAIGYLAQIPVFHEEMTVKEVWMGAFAEAIRISDQLTECEKMMESFSDGEVMNHLLKKYGDLQERYLQLGGYEIESKILRVARGLQLDALLNHKYMSLSGGEQTKVGLALNLLKEPDLLLLDEPTNHLDVEAAEWLEGYLKEYSGTVAAVSHDRYFLDEVVFNNPSILLNNSLYFNKQIKRKNLNSFFTLFKSEISE